MNIFNKKHPMPGFPMTKDTGIPALQSWFVESTLKTRKFNAESLLESIVSFEKSITPWLADRTIAFKMAQDERSTVEMVFNKDFDELKKKFSTTNIKVSQQCRTLVEKDIFSKMSKAEDDAAKEAERTVSNWRMKPMHWGIHRTVNRHLGTYTSSKNVDYKWNEELAGCYTGALLTPWTYTFHDKLPSTRTSYDKGIKEQLTSFVEEVTEIALSICPAIVEPVEHWMESSFRTFGKIQENSLLIFDETLQDTARDAHRLVAPKILEIWSDVYVACRQEKGQGHYKRNQGMHMEHVKENRTLMFRRGSAAIRRMFIKKWTELPSEFEKGTKSALCQIMEELEQMMCNHTLSIDKATNDKLCEQVKQDLQDDAV